MAKKQFKAESKRLLDMMINSIYTHKEIFLRELISNASDAIDKLYFRSLTDDSVKLKKKDFFIRLAAAKENRTLTVRDNGIGMTKEELEKNLGTIAKSGSLDFKNENETGGKVDVIGQFGVGFYSAFMVASRVTVRSRAFGAQEAWQWESTGAEGYTIEPCDKEDVGTEVILVVKENEGEEHYDEFLDDWRLAGIVKKYSDYIRYPIKMLREKSRAIEGTDKDEEGHYKAPEYETYTEDETLNSMVPIWKRDKKKVKDEEYAQFYKDKFGDYSDPARVIQSKTEGTATFNALLFIPSRTPYNYYTKEYEKGLQLYSSGVLIMEKCADLLPDYFSFVKGLVDSEDLSLNISREMLQHDSQLKLIKTTLERKIKNELAAWLKNDREKYEEFFRNFGLQLKMGCYASYGMNKELLQDLLLFHSAKENKLVTLREYYEAMPEDQKYIYYAAGESTDRLAKLPAAERVLDKGFDILYLTDDVDEFMLQMLRSYGDKEKEKEFRNISADDLGIETDAEKEEVKAKNEENKELFEAMKEALDGKVTEVRLSQRLKSHPVCLSSSGPLSIEMEKVLNSMPAQQEKVKSEKVLELNGEHEVFAALKRLFEAGDKEKLAAYSEILYDQALLIEGLALEDPVAYANNVCKLMV
ncbi:molecular chaperone HtpG [Subdoligranulum sp. OF01-18]|uniref:molecular chaperone HtpG n=2 Tax=Ruthenibacterium lactatiformans TaxID=1550024 RepID=UPI000E713584|nr:molecular chaperone HtpG [Ruthenibacterium lactatiformans]RJW82287.1 molecular chaperone HtpG [Subdoligranulum sp. OF01-18]